LKTRNKQAVPFLPVNFDNDKCKPSIEEVPESEVQDDVTDCRLCDAMAKIISGQKILLKLLYR
jgi:hypothetical protein